MRAAAGGCGAISGRRGFSCFRWWSAARSLAALVHPRVSCAARHVATVAGLARRHCRSVASCCGVSSGSALRRRLSSTLGAARPVAVGADRGAGLMRAGLRCCCMPIYWLLLGRRGVARASVSSMRRCRTAGRRPSTACAKPRGSPTSAPAHGPDQKCRFRSAAASSGLPLEAERRDEPAVLVHQIDDRGVVHRVVAVLERHLLGIDPVGLRDGGQHRRRSAAQRRSGAD